VWVEFNSKKRRKETLILLKAVPNKIIIVIVKHLCKEFKQKTYQSLKKRKTNLPMA